MPSFRILVVDDSQINRRLLRAVLESEGLTVSEAGDGVEALAVLAREPVDAIISDVLMPNMDGIRLCLEVRKHERYHNLAFVIHTATYNSGSDRRIAMDAGADDFLIKPAPPAEILRALADARERAARRSRSVPAPAGEVDVIKQYNVALIEKLEERNRELQQAYEELQASEELFRQLAETIHVVFWLADAGSGRIIYVSPAFSVVWGRSQVDLRRPPRDWLDVIHADDRERMRASALREPLRGGYDAEFRVQRPDGSVRWIRDRAFPVRNSGGEVYRVAGVAEDITARKDLEEQFRQAQKMDAIGRLSGGVAHDFNNLLTVIVGQVGLLQSLDSIPPEASESLTAISEAVDRAANLTRQLLLFSRRQAIAPRVVDRNQVVGGMMKMLARIVSEDITLRFERSSRPLPVHADVGMLEQVLLNLVVNARDALPRGGEVLIETDTTEHAASASGAEAETHIGAWVRLRVSDTGCGIAPEHLPRIFEPFFTTKAAGKGTGLGLATVYGIVQQHRGWIDVRSAAGIGSTFFIHLPQYLATEIEPLRTKVVATQDRGHETILLVEDDRSVRRLVSIVLRAAGYRVIEAATGAEAVELWQKQSASVHLLLTDIVMPRGISGRELAERFTLESPQLRVIFMSGYNADLDDREERLQPNAVFIAKPFDGDRLLATVRSALDQAVG